MITIDDSLFIAKGGERNCYFHPSDNNKVVKVVHRKEKHNEQNKLEDKYYKYLKEQNIPLTHLSKCYGIVSTNIGEGLVYDYVLDYDLKASKTFKYFLENKIFSKSIELKLVDDLKKYLFEYDILFIDVDLSNLFCQEYEKNKFRLIIVDGLGARRLNWRFYLYLKSKFFSRYKIKKQWKKFYNNYLKFTRYK